MKEISSRVRKHDSAVRSKRKEYDDHRDAELKSHSKNILKETHHKNHVEEFRSKRRKESDLKCSSHSKKSKQDERSNSPHHVRRSNHRKDADESSNPSEREDLPSRRKNHRENEIGESYEELSKRKQRIESELHALDLEEAAEREAKKKKPKKEVSGHSKRRENSAPIREVKHFPIKQEPISDDSDYERHSSDHNRKNPQKRKHNNQVNLKPSDDERSWGKPQEESKKAVKEKEKPNFSVSGKLAEDTNMYNGVVIKYNEPAEARKPRRKWRLYPFKGDTNLPFIPIHRQSAYLFGRSRLIADIPIDHPSCSKQHAVLQFRLVPYKREDGSTGKRVRPYIIDLESSNGTFVNNKKVDHRCYVELIEKDVVKFGYSSREYVLLHEESKNDSEDDDIIEAND